LSLVKSAVVGHHDPENVNGYRFMTPSEFALPRLLFRTPAAQLASAVPTVRKPGVPRDSLAEWAPNLSATRTTLRATRLTTAAMARTPLHMHLRLGRFLSGIAVQIPDCFTGPFWQPAELLWRGSRVLCVRLGRWCRRDAEGLVGPSGPILGVPRQRPPRPDNGS